MGSDNVSPRSSSNENTTKMMKTFCFANRRNFLVMVGMTISFFIILFHKSSGNTYLELDDHTSQSTSSSPANPFRGTLTTTTATTSKKITMDERCKQNLDKLEAVWDERRDVRVNIGNKARKAKKDVYDFLFKDTDNSSKKNWKALRMFDLWEPEAVCLVEERFGGNSEQRYYAIGDGPKFACGVDYLRDLSASKPKEENCLVYSIGSNNNILFERSVKQHIGCEIHTFDPTLKSKFVGDEYATFHPWGLGKDGGTVTFRGDSTFTTRSLDKIMFELDHEGRKIDIFKIDCEGCEYDAMPPIFKSIADGNLQIDQILIELHKGSYEVLQDFFEDADKAGFRITHKERNHWGCGGHGCVEYALVSKSFLRESTAYAMC